MSTAITKPEKKRITPAAAWRDARELVWAHRYRLALGMLLMMINRMAGLVLPSSSKYVIDDIVLKHQSNLLLPLAVAVGTATLLQALSSFALSQTLGVAAQRAITDMRRSVQEHIARLPIRYFDSTQTGVLISRIMTDAEGIRNLVGTGLVQLVGSLVTAAAGLVVLFYLNWRLTSITLLALATFGGVMAFAFNKLRPLFRERGKINAEVTGRLTESLGGIRIVKAYAAEKREELVFARGAHRLFRNVARSLTAVSAVMAFATTIVGIIGVILILVGGQDLIAGRMTLGDFAMYVIFTALVAMPLVEIANIGTQITEAFAGLDRIREIKRMTTEDADDGDREALSSITGEVEFKDVTFEYSDDTPVLKHVSFQAAAGSTTALVGSSGSGKSTLISLVMAFNRPLAGEITVDGRDLASLRLRDYRNQLGVVLQDNFLFDGSIAENIGFSHPHATREEIVAASRVAHCEEFINGFADGYDTIVGERGVKLSGGQRQRVAIARAILAEPKILILDEATSSLDSESEALIQDGLQTLRRGRTTFVIAHRLSTIRSADQILVLEAGEIVERGTHEELLAAEGRYKQLYDKQYNFERNQFINPGEDFTPELPSAAKAAPATDAMPTNL
ncbi:MAG TPA: ABC transporter ATP-binding protein [Pyrinomonadaceae bacterium]|jgi:subfamily B ATP-binding cassette protein MsbA|nr:ABC transporter ATP-binding protein [Pyrinomonadaceae bacterium]